MKVIKRLKRLRTSTFVRYALSYVTLLAIVLAVVFPLGTSTQGSKGTMMFLIKESVYIKLFADAIEDSNNTYIFHDEQLLAQECDFDIPAELIAQQLNKNRELQIEQFRHDGESWLLLSHHGADWGMRYVTVLRAADMSGSAWRSMYRLSWALLAVGAAGVLVALNVHMYLMFASEPDTLYRMTEAIRETTMERSGHAIVALSGVKTDFFSAPAAYLEEATAYDNRFVMDENRILDYSTISTSIEDILPKARKMTDGINQTLILNNCGLLSGKIDELLQLLKHTNMSPFVFRLIYNDTIAMLLRERTASLASDHELKELYDIFSLSNCQSLDDLDGLLRKLCHLILKTDEKVREPDVEAEQPSVIMQVVSYIQDHFADQELSISAIAEAFDMPTARLSLAFKDIMRMSPLEYLTLLRVERSKALLSESDRSIKDIAAAVGYYDSSSFIRRFKQMTGITPL